MSDFRDEISGYNNNAQIYSRLKSLSLKDGIENIPSNMLLCYKELIEMNLVKIEELELLKLWIKDISLLTFRFK